MRYPRIEIDLNKIRSNTQTIVDMCHRHHIDVVGVTKVFCAEKEIVEQMIAGGISIIGDSRIENLIKLKSYDLPKLLLRLPMLSQVEAIIEHVDITLNSELRIIRALSEEAAKKQKRHQIILMVDLGDLREGIFDEETLIRTVESVISMEYIDLIGIGTNLTCYGGILPDKDNLERLLAIRSYIEKTYNIPLKVVSGGNSSSIYLLESGKIPEGINQLRLGESIVLGRETAFGLKIKGTSQDTMILQCEIVELQEKPSVPIGVIGMDAFGHVPTFEDHGMRQKAICAIGKQDVNPDDIRPLDQDIKILGGSSDYMILDVTDASKKYQVGDIISFSVSYGSVLSLFTSAYINKVYVSNE
ncbi:alanine/ornithine racemase family PLP-dependent enzyme [Vallitalea pronyensis]|uniref:Alanine/ornithine racemase family PLP-dependent enzyme n=2 Tax=Vallitalea pronyensis TaxID=1348613 RepID=A0A8J8MPU9_9FIRM|nr:ornithine racemase Orr [Vallitalea pronyensis]QUI25775.1 alanine/ornithine racemase family PLP-dependent enzyme [Vallitalea pronyensis]